MYDTSYCRWKWAHTKKNENDKLLKRKICLEDELKRLVRRRVEKEFEEANIRKEIVTQEQTLDEIQQKIYEERKETMKIERKLFHMDALAQRYEKMYVGFDVSYRVILTVVYCTL
jgi:uncharacterized coiled-coil protein SlyX